MIVLAMSVTEMKLTQLGMALVMDRIILTKAAYAASATHGR